jgi:DNA-binding CsgD family transcriptional regulator
VDIYQIGFLEDITEQLADTLALSHRLKIEERLGKIAANLIQTPTDEIGESIDHVLKEIGEWIQADRCYLFYIDNNAHCMSNTHEWCAEGISTQRDFLQNLPLQMFPWVIQKLQSNTVINVPNVQNMTDEAAAERTILQMQDILSVLLVPVIADETLIGFVGFDGVVDHRIWTEADIVVLQLVADLIGSALQRLEHDVSMGAYEIRLSMALAASSSGLIDYDVTSNLAYLSPEFYATLGFTDICQSRQVPLEMLWSWIHPDDLPRVQQAAKDVINNKTRFHQCFRIRNVCDQYCWYCLRAENLIHPLIEKHRVIGVLSDMTINTQALTKRESEVLDLLAEDLTVKEIACRLAISHHTVDNHLRKIYAKLGAQTKLQSILRANSIGLLHFA